MGQKEGILFSSLPSNEISVVIASRNESTYLRSTVAQLQATLPAASEIIVVDDGSIDGSADFLAHASDGIKLLRTEGLGAIGARNLGAAASRGKIIVFADAHVTPPPGWAEPIIDSLANPEVGAVAPAISVMGDPANKGFGLVWTGSNLQVDWLGQQGRSPYPVALLPGAFIALRREVFEATGGFDEGLVHWGSEDAELSLRLWLLGYELRLVPQVEVAHLFREKHPYQIKWAAVIHNLLRVAFVHFSEERIARVTDSLKHFRDFAPALALIAQSDVWLQRAKIGALRLHDDEWFFNSFGIAC
jgi:GT2 family glycosyltransferase